MKMKCELCGTDREDLIHFILECQELNTVRVKSIELQRPWQQNDEVSVGLFLFQPEDFDKMSQKTTAIRLNCR